MHIGISPMYDTVAVVVFIMTAAIFFASLWHQQGPPLTWIRKKKKTMFDGGSMPTRQLGSSTLVLPTASRPVPPHVHPGWWLKECGRCPLLGP